MRTPASLSSGREISKIGGSEGGRDSCRIFVLSGENVSPPLH